MADGRVQGGAGGPPPPAVAHAGSASAPVVSLRAAAAINTGLPPPHRPHQSSPSTKPLIGPGRRLIHPSIRTSDGEAGRGGLGGGRIAGGVPLPRRGAVPVPAAAGRRGRRLRAAQQVPAGGAGRRGGGAARRRLGRGVDARVVAHARQGRGRARRGRRRRGRGARRLDGAAPVGAGQVRADRGGVRGQAHRGVPGLRRHLVSHRGRPGRRLHERDDAHGRAQRRQALPDGDRERAVPGQGVWVREAGGALLRRQPRHGHQGTGQGLFFPARKGQGQRSGVPAGERVPADDRGGARAPGRDDALHPGGQGGEQQVLRLRPLQMRRRKYVGRAVGGGEGRAAWVPEAAAVAGAEGAGGAAQHQVGQGQGARVPARVARLRGPRQRPARLHRRRPHRRGRLQGAAPPGTRRGNPRVQAPQGHHRLLLASGASRGDGVPAAPRRVEAPRVLQGQAPAAMTARRAHAAVQ